MAENSRTRSVQKSSPERDHQGQNKNRDVSVPAAQPEWLNQAAENPTRARPEDVLALQQRFGNQVVQRVLDSTVQRRALTNEKGELQPDLAAEIANASQGGQALSAPVREGMSQQLGHDFSGVRIHTDRRSDTLNRQLQARAFTVGNSIFFSQGAYDPHSTQGRHTLAHELTHVVQQSGGGRSGPLKLGEPDDAYEKEADRVATNREAAAKAGLAAGMGVVQRLPSWKSIKGFFGSNAAVTPGPGNPVPQAQVAPQAPPPVQAPVQQPAEVIPQGITADVWIKLKANGVADATDWDGLLAARRQAILQALAVSEKLAKLLIAGARQNQWPQDAANTDILSGDVLKQVLLSAGNVSISAWNLLGDRRSTILDCLTNSAVPLGIELIKAAQNNSWPKDGSDADITQKDKISQIRNELKTSLLAWSKLTLERRKVILAAQAVDAARALELTQAAAAGKWPEDNAQQGLADYPSWWGPIKEAAPMLTPSQWNAFTLASRGDIIAATTAVDKKNLINQAMYARKKEVGALEKAGEFAENPVFEALSGGGGTASSIAGALEDDKTSGIVGATADAADTLIQGTSFLGAFSKYRRGKRMDKQGLSSRAAQSFGKKQKREGLWGMAQGALGLGGSISSMVGNVSKGHDPDKDEEDGTSETTDKISGSFAIAGGAMSSVKGGMGLFKAFRRSGRAQEFVDETATGDKKTLSDIAAFTQKKQNRMGKMFETLKGASSILSGVSSIIGNDVFGSVMGGIGLASGIGQAIATKAGAPEEGDLAQKAADLVALLRAKNVDAIRFAREVLNITDVTPDTPDGWLAWVLEDPEAVKDLIESKLSKHG
jgi:hypothetical protein